MRPPARRTRGTNFIYLRLASEKYNVYRHLEIHYVKAHRRGTILGSRGSGAQSARGGGQTRLLKLEKHQRGNLLERPLICVRGAVPRR